MTQSSNQNIVWNLEVDKILSDGYYLGELGVKNWALSKKDAHIAIMKLFQINVPILGGDVYFQRNSGICSGTDSWYCKKNSGESAESFLIRSTKHSKNYVIKFKSLDSSNTLFAFVPG